MTPWPQEVLTAEEMFPRAFTGEMIQKLQAQPPAICHPRWSGGGL